MESGGHKSGSGAVSGTGAEGGLLCHACGYQYPNAHPSAKQRRAHRKHCGKPASAAAEEPEGRVLFPGEGGGAVSEGGDGIGAGAAECGGGLPGSAQEPAGSAPVDVDKSDHSSHDDPAAQVIVDKCVEDQSDAATEITLPETNRTDDGGTVNEVVTEYSGKASPPEEVVPSVPTSTVSSVQLQDVSVPVLQPEPGYGEGVSVSEMNSNVVAVPSDGTGGEISGQTNDVLTEPNGTTATGVDDTGNTIDKDIPSEEKFEEGGDLDASCQENLQTKVEEGHGKTEVEEDLSDKNLGALQIKEIPNDKPESNEQSSPMLTRSTEVVPKMEEPVKSGTQVAFGTDDCHLEVTDTVKTQEQPDSTSMAADHLAVPEQTDIFEGEHYPNKDGGIETISSAVGPNVSSKVISVGDADNMTKNVSPSDITMGDSIQENATNNTVVSSQADHVDLSTSSAAHENSMENSTNDVEEKGDNEKSVADLTTHEINEVHITDLVDEKQQDKEIIADFISHETNAVGSTDSYGENQKETIAEASSCNVPSTDSIEEQKQIEETIANPAPEKTNVTSNREDVEDNKQIEVDVMTNREISVVCTTEAIEEKDTTEINAGNITSNVEDKKQIEEISAGNISDVTSMICSTVNEAKMHNEDITADPSTHEKNEDITVNEEKIHNEDMTADPSSDKKNEETMVHPTSHSTGIVPSIENVDEGKNDEASADITSHVINATHATDDVEEKKAGEPILEPISSKISTVGRVGDVEEKQNEDQISGENSMPVSTDDAEKVMQNNGAGTVLVSDKSEVAKETDAVEGTEQNIETTAKEISTIQTVDDSKGAGQNEEIADKEVIVDSDRSHVSLKVLLADKNVETKEKKPSTKDRVLSFRRRSPKDESPVTPGSPKAGSGQQDWNSPARLPAEKKTKGKKQQWVPFICCSSIH